MAQRGVEESVELHNRLEPKLLRALEMIAPGSFIREGIDEVLQGDASRPVPRLRPLAPRVR